MVDCSRAPKCLSELHDAVHDSGSVCVGSHLADAQQHALAFGAVLAIVEGALVVVDGQLAGAPHCHRLIVRKPLLRAHDLVLPDDRIAFIVMPRDNTPNLKCHSDLLQSWVVVAGEPAKPGASSEPGSFSVGSSVS